MKDALVPSPFLPSAQLENTSLWSSVKLFLRSLAGRNVSPLTIQAYQIDLRQFLEYLAETNVAIDRLEQVTRADITEYLSHLAGLGRSGVTRARKLAAIKEFFKYLVDNETIATSPAAGVAVPKRERKVRVFLRTEEYSRMLAAAGGSPRDYAILQLFLQTGIRVSELANLQLAHLDLQARTLTVVAGKGKKDRDIELEKKAMTALRSYLAIRPDVPDEHVFLSYQDKGLSIRGVQDVVEKYAKLAGIEKKFSAHSLRHTFATYKAERVSPWLLKEWLGHSSISTTQLYVHENRRNARRAMEETSL